jgi:hypothetical protein
VKATEQAPDLAARALTLTRMDTWESTASSIAFAPAQPPAHHRQTESSSSPLSGVPMQEEEEEEEEDEEDSFEDSFDLVRRPSGGGRMSKLSRTLGAEFGSGFGGPGVSVPPPGALHRPTTSVASTTTSLSYGYGASLLQRAASTSTASHSSVWDAAEYGPQPPAYRAMRSTCGAAQTPCYPHPDGPNRHLEDSDNDDSAVLSLPGSRSARSSTSSGLGEVHVQPAFELSDSDAESDAEYDWRADTPTPARLAPYSNTNTDAGADSRANTPLPASAQRFASPFQTMPLFVVPGPWEPAPAPTAASTGEWNEADMQAVIRALRGLRA